MEQVYWVSSRTDGVSDLRSLVYVYGRYVYAGEVVTEPLYSSEGIPALVQGLQAVQGSVPFLGEKEDLLKSSAGGPARSVLRTLEAVSALLYDTLCACAPLLAARAGEEPESFRWLDDDDVSLYFELPARHGHDCGGADLVFAKKYMGEVLLTLIWYAGSGCYSAALSGASGEEQALVDTLFPSIYGRARGVTIMDLPREGAVYNGEEEDVDSLTAGRVFTSVSVWEASQAVPDPDAVPFYDEEEEEAVAQATKSGVVDISGGDGYTQVYVCMRPAGGVTTATSRNGLVPRSCIFRFGDWVYAGVADFPVDELGLGDVPYVLPAMQKQQGRLGFLCEATSFPVDSPATATMSSFMAAVAMLKQEMTDSQEDVAALASNAMTAWIDEEWSASFFELTLDGTSLPAGLQQVEVIACKVYLSKSSGVILHVVLHGRSLYCVLADSVEDLPLLDVAFPDVTARNRVVQVRGYNASAARALTAAHGGASVCPTPVALRVWEGRRKGVAGVPGPAVQAATSAGEAIREKARARAEQEAREAAEAAAKVAAAEKSMPKPTPTKAEGAVSVATTTAATKATPAETKGSGAAAAAGSRPTAEILRRVAAPKEEAKTSADDGDDDDLYDMSGMAANRLGGAAKGKGADTGASKSAAGAASGSSSRNVAASSMSALSSVTRAPHRVAPLSRAATASRLAAEVESDGKEAEAPWDASGRPRALAPL